MARSGPIYLDTNVLVHAFEKRDELSRLLVELLVRSSRGGPAVVTSQLTYAEAIQKPYADRDENSIALVSSWLREGTKSLLVAPIDADLLFVAAALRASYKSLKLPDAIHLSTALSLESRFFLRADRRLPDRIELMDQRFGISRTADPLPVVPPAVQLVQQLIGEILP